VLRGRRSKTPWAVSRATLLWARVLALERRCMRRPAMQGAAIWPLPAFYSIALSNNKIRKGRSTMGELVRRVGGVSMTREATHAVEYVDVVTAVEATAMRSTRRVGDTAINYIDYLKLRQKDIEQRNPDAAEMVAAVVNGINVAIVHRARQYAIELGG
jgi:hypothetical protein